MRRTPTSTKRSTRSSCGRGARGHGRREVRTDSRYRAGVMTRSKRASVVRRGGAGALALGVAIVSVQGCADRARIATQGRTRDTPSGAATLDLAAPVSASASARAAPPDGTDPRLEARLLELEARSDKRSTVRGKHDPNPAPTRPPRPLPAKGSFPSSSAIASIRAYASTARSRARARRTSPTSRSRATVGSATTWCPRSPS